MCKRVREHDESQKEEMSFWNGNHLIDFCLGVFRHNGSISLSGIAFPLRLLDAVGNHMEMDLSIHVGFTVFYKAAWVININLFI